VADIGAAQAQNPNGRGKRPIELPMDPIKTKDSRSKRWIAEGRTEKCEMEALAPDLLAELVRSAIEDHIDTDVRDEVLDAMSATP
jgi:hypothetical protein